MRKIQKGISSKIICIKVFLSHKNVKFELLISAFDFFKNLINVKLSRYLNISTVVN